MERLNAKNMIAEDIRQGTILDESYAGLMVRKWGRLVEDIRDTYRKRSLAILLENTMHALKSLQEATATPDTGQFIKFLFPIVRRVWAKLIANDIFSVQPMTAPVGAVFYYKPIYGTSKGQTTAGTEMIKNFDIYYSGPTVYNERVHTGDGGPIEATDNVFLDFLPVVPKSVTINYTSAGNPRSATDKNGDGILYIGATNVGTVNYTTGQITISENVDNGTIVYGIYEYNMELNTQIPEVNLSITYDEVKAKTRKLKAIWSAEAAEDLRALHGIDAEDELISAIASEIALEVDRELINDVYTQVPIPSSYPDPAYRYVEWDRKRPQYVSEHDHLLSLLTAISIVSNRIHRDTHRGPANWIVTSPDICSLLDQLPGFVPTEDTQRVSDLGIQKVGVLSKRWTVYKDPYFVRDRMLVGLKGATFLDSGYVYAPYVPLQVTPTFYDPTDFGLKKGLRTRYTKKMVYNEFFGIVKVLNIDAIYL